VRIALLVAAGCFWVSGTRLAEAAARFTLEYDAPAGCPTREAFIEAVRQRLPDAEESQLEAPFAFRVTIEAEGELVRGRVVLGDGAPPREVVPAPCADVASSMALMIAIVLGGEARAREAESAEEKQPEAPPAKPTPVAPANRAAKPVTRPTEAIVVAPRGTPDAPSEPVSLRAGVWGAAGLSDGVAPFPAFAVSGGAELEVEAFGGWRPSVRVGAMYVTGDTSVASRGNAEFGLSGFAGRLCPHAFSVAVRWSLAACGSLEVGELTARGVSTPGGREQRMQWLAFGVAPRAELALGRVVSLEAELGVRGIVRHDRFVFEPDATEVYDVPRFAPHLAVGASARFP